MPDQSDKPELYKYTARRVLEKLHEELQDMFHGYFYGDPIVVGKSLLPALVVEWERSTPQLAPTRSDKWQHNLIIKVIVNKMDDAGIKFNEASQIIDVPTKATLERFIFARDADTKAYIDKCILGVIRRNFTLNGAVNDQSATVEFGSAQRPTNEGKYIVTAEAHIRMLASETIRVTDRA